MMHHEKPLPPNWTATAGWAVGVLAFLLSLYGGFVAPGRLLSPTADPAALSPAAVRLVGYWGPLAVGLAAVGLGLAGLRDIEKAGGNLAGDWQGVFAVLLGGLAAVTGAVQVFAAVVWPAVRG